MTRWLTGLTALQVLSGCAALAGIFPSLAGDTGPLLMKADTKTTINGRDYSVDMALDRLSKGTTDTRRYTLEVDDFTDTEGDLINRVFPDYRSAIAYAESKNNFNFLPSADMVTAITKQVNDGLYARFELALEHGEGGFTAKQTWLQPLLNQSFNDTSTQARLDVAARLAGTQSLVPPPSQPGAVSFPADVTSTATAGLKAFQANLMASKPIGFYTWTSELSSIFRRDRWLQGWFGDDNRAWISREGTPYPNPAAADRSLESGAYMATLLSGDAAKGHEQALAFYRRMTNPFSGYAPKDLAQLLPPGKTLSDAMTDASVRQAMLTKANTATTPPLQYWAILPPSTSPESELFYKLDRAGLLKPGQDRMQVLIDSIRNGQLSLAPTPDSGFYAYQQHALESLLKVTTLPEGNQLTYGDRYQKRLEEAFKTGMAKARETHAKQLDNYPVALTAAPVQGPYWAVEPLPTYYERLANSYTFLKAQVLSQFDPAFLKSATILTDGGKTGTVTIQDQVDQAERLMQGLAVLAKAEVNLGTASDSPALAEASQWLRTLGQDARLGVDTRVAVPVNQYADANNIVWTQYWGTAGVTLTKVKVSAGNDKTYLLVTDKFIFFDRPNSAGPLNRDEYRAILDKSANLNDALKQLQPPPAAGK